MLYGIQILGKDAPGGVIRIEAIKGQNGDLPVIMRPHRTYAVPNGQEPTVLKILRGKGLRNPHVPRLAYPPALSPKMGGIRSDVEDTQPEFQG